MKGSENTVILTHHSKHRIQERIGVPKKRAKKIAENAYKKGIRHYEIDRSLKRYIDKLYLSHRTANQLRVYKDYIFLFSGNLLITVLNVPYWYKNN